MVLRVCCAGGLVRLKNVYPLSGLQFDGVTLLCISGITLNAA